MREAAGVGEGARQGGGSAQGPAPALEGSVGVGVRAHPHRAAPQSSPPARVKVPGVRVAQSHTAHPWYCSGQSGPYTPIMPTVSQATGH